MFTIIKERNSPKLNMEKKVGLNIPHNGIYINDSLLIQTIFEKVNGNNNLDEKLILNIIIGAQY